MYTLLILLYLIFFKNIFINYWTLLRLLVWMLKFFETIINVSSINLDVDIVKVVVNYIHNSIIPHENRFFSIVRFGV